MLIGREGECNAIERVLARAQAGEAASLVLRAEAGVGKTALLRFAIERAAGSMRAVRATGIESEAELEYSALLEVCRPLLSELERLPERQAGELRVALGLEAGSTPDRFGVGAATLSLVAAAAESEPLLVVVDDAQWLDHASASALLFAARRLLADRVAFFFATREDGFDAAGIDELRLVGLDPEATAALVERATGRRPAPDAAAALHAATGGNPLALLELPERLDAADLAGGGALGRPLPVTEQIERAFARRLHRLPDATRRALCVLAAAGTEALATPLAAMRRLGLEAEALVPAEDAGLIALDAASCRFQHPLLRAVAYHDRVPSERRAAHRALADELESTASTEQTAWHLATAAVGVDERAADALAAAAASALARGGHSAAAAALERAARLTPEPALRVDRLADAAELAWNGGESARAAALVEEALASAADVPTRVRLLALAGRIEYQEGQQARARELFLGAVDLLGDEDRAQAIRMLGFVVFTCFNEGRIEEAIEVARRARSLVDGTSNSAILHGDYLLGRALLLAGRSEGAPLLASLVDRVRDPEGSRVALTRLATTLVAIDRVDEAAAAAQRAVTLGREEGPMVLMHGLSILAGITVRSSSWAQTLAACTEGVELARQLGQDNVVAVFLSVLGYIGAARGEEESCRRNVAEALAVFERSGTRAEAERLRLALALLDLGLDRLPAAIERLEAVADAVTDMGLYDRDVAPEPELVEALVHAGRSADAERRLERWLARAATEATLWAPPLAARCHGLLAGEAEFADHFERALALHAETTDLFQLARTHVAYGQRLRRAGRRVDARSHLRHALDLFERLEAAPWAERARQELRASGEKLRRAAFSGDELTPQELQIALQVAEGKQNKEVAAAMFLSPKTVEFHLGRIYRKLDIGSRAELVRRYAGEMAAVPA